VVGLFYVKWFPYYTAVRGREPALHRQIHPDGHAASAPRRRGSCHRLRLRHGKASGKRGVGLLSVRRWQALIPPQWVARALGRTDFSSVVKGGLLSLRHDVHCRARRSWRACGPVRPAPGAAIAFWLGNTALNPATLIFMGFVLGWQWRGLRLALGIVIGVRPRLSGEPDGYAERKPSVARSDGATGHQRCARHCLRTLGEKSSAR